MWTTLALAAALGVSPGQNGSLTLTNVRTTYGVLGAPRPDSKFLPGGSATFSFTVEGVKPDDNGKVRYSMGMEVTDSSGQVQFKQEPRDLEATTSLGGNSLTAAAHLDIGLDHPPGNYKVKVTVTDRSSGASGSLTHAYEVLPKAFGLVRPAVTGDPDARVPAPFPVAGQTVWVNFAAVAFDRDGDGGQPNLRVVLRVLDEDGQPTLPKPLIGEVTKDIPKNAQAVPMQFILELNRAGRFTIEVAALDRVSQKKASLSLPLTVYKGKT